MKLYVAEFIGTAILILLGCGVNAGVTLKRSAAKDGGWIVITLAWGLAVTMGIFAVGQISGAHLNPAVTIAMATIGDLPWKDVPGFIIAQILGAVVGATLVWLAYLPLWEHTEDQGAKLGIFATGPAVRDLKKNVITEIIGTFVLVFGILMIGANNLDTGMGAFAVGALIVVIGMSLGGPTGYAINPARDLGPRIAHAILPIPGKGTSDWGYAWVPIVGPIVGGVLGAVAYRGIFALLG